MTIEDRLKQIESDRRQLLARFQRVLLERNELRRQNELLRQRLPQGEKSAVTRPQEAAERLYPPASVGVSDFGKERRCKVPV